VPDPAAQRPLVQIVRRDSEDQATMPAKRHRAEVVAEAIAAGGFKKARGSTVVPREGKDLIVRHGGRGMARLVRLRPKAPSESRPGRTLKMREKQLPLELTSPARYARELPGELPWRAHIFHAVATIRGLHFPDANFIEGEVRSRVLYNLCKTRRLQETSQLPDFPPYGGSSLGEAGTPEGRSLGDRG
jgi:hypothetical protein